MKQDIGLDLCLVAAEQHGKDGTPEHEIGDLQQCLRQMWSMLTPGQRLGFMADLSVKQQIEDNLPEVDIDDAFHRLAEALRIEIVEAQALGRPIDLFSSLASEFPGLLDNSDVNGSDTVDWLNSNLQAIKAASDSQIDQDTFDDVSPAPSM